MGLLGTSAQAFTDNFLKTYMAIGEDRRAEASLKIAEKMAQAKLEEIARENAMRDTAAQYQQGLMAPVKGPMQAPIQQTQPKLGLLGGQSIPLGDPNLLNQPTQQTYANQYDAWTAEGKDPQRESLLGLSNIIIQHDPIKAAEIRSRVFNTDERVQAQREIAAARNEAMLEGIKERLSGAIEQLKMKGDLDSKSLADKLEVKLKEIELRSQKSNEGKQTDTDDAYESYKAEKKKQGVPDSKLWPRYKFDIWYKQQTQKPSAAETIFNGGRQQMQWNAATGKFE